MSLTGTHHLFAGVSEDGINDLVAAFFSARPRYLRFGSPPFVGATTASATQTPSLPFPGVPGGVPYLVQFGLPIFDLSPVDPLAPPPPSLVLGPGQVSIFTTVDLTLGCLGGDIGRDRPRKMSPTETQLDVWAIGTPVMGGSGIGFDISAVDLPQVRPDSLRDVFDCLLEMLLAGALRALRLPLQTVTVGVAVLSLEDGPTITSDELDVWGSIT